MSDSILVIIPTYNERENLEPILDRVFAAVPTAHVLVVDDASPDGTGAIADERSGADERLHVLHRPGKSGLGSAYIAGFDWGLHAGYDVLVEMDADGSHDPAELPRLLQVLDGADLVIGARWVPGGSVVNWPRSRELLSRGANLYARLALGMGLGDATGGFRAFRAATLDGIDYRAVASQGYCFQVDLAWRAVQAGYRVAEVPITFTDRVRGESKMNGTIVREALWRLTAWGVRHRAGQVRALLGQRR